MAKINLAGPSGPPATRFPVATPGFKPSPEQAAIFLEVAAGTSNLIVEAVAGAGKTTTLVEICKLIEGNAAFLAFNKKIATEIGTKLRAAGIEETRVKPSTFHALGFAAWRRVATRVQVKEEKSEQLMESLQVPVHLRAFVKQLASLAKQAVFGAAFVPEDRDDWLDMIDHYDVAEKLTAGVTSIEQQAAEGIGWTHKLLVESLNRAQTLIDFDDMIWVPLVMDEVVWPQYDWLLVDEAQDTNAARRLMCERTLRPGGRLIAVGDRHQAIYGFTGADARSLDLIAERFKAKYMPLTTTYRCPKAVVRHAHQWVSHIQAAESAPEGDVRTITRAEFEHDLGTRGLEPEDAILCRNTKPLVSLAFDLIRRKIPCHVEGREIGKGLLALARRWRSVTTIGQLEQKLAEYLREETERLRKTGKLAKIGAVEDKVETLLVLCESLAPNDQIWKLEQVVNSLFQDSDGKQRPSVTLSTVHKAKGREWDRVFLLGRDEFMPSKYATQPWQQEQEDNLCYVAVTRAKRELIEIRTLPAAFDPRESPGHTDLMVTPEETAAADAPDPWGRERPELDNFDDQAAAALDAECGYDPREVPLSDPAERIELFRQEAGLFHMTPEDKYRALYEQRPPKEEPTFRHLTYYCPVKGKDFNVGREDISIRVEDEETWLTIPRCFCAQSHRMRLS